MRPRIGDSALPQAFSEPLPAALEFAASVLTARPSSRPPPARAYAAALRRMLGR